jgi:prepilin signal peptidase PulO-like enzyme (type II secretory pathway)
MVPLIAFVVGAFIASFLNVCIHRLPRHESVLRPPSRCSSCGTRVQWYDNLPVVSYLMLRGRCRWCDAAFSPRYLVTEVVAGLLSAGIVAWVFAPGKAGVQAPWLMWAVSLQPGCAGQVADFATHLAAASALLTLAYYLLVSAMIDLEHSIIPDVLTRPFQLAAPLLAVLVGANLAYGEPIGYHWLLNDGSAGPGVELGITGGRFLVHVLAISGGVLLFLLLSLIPAHLICKSFSPPAQPWRAEDQRGLRIGVYWFCACTLVAMIALALVVWLRPAEWWPALALHGAQALFGSLAGWLSLYLVRLLGTFAFRRSARGFGDFEFLAPIGAFLGPVGMLYAFFAAALIGTLVSLPLRLFGGSRTIPFGPYLAAGSLLVLVGGPQLHHWLFGPLLQD